MNLRNGTYYLNNSGNRWVAYENGEKPQFYVKDEAGEFHLRTTVFFESWGNFACNYFYWKGFRVCALPQDYERHEGKAVVYEKTICWPICHITTSKS